MKTALLYDELSDGGPASWVEAEYESPETIQALLAAIAEHCDEAVPVPFGPELVPQLRRHAPDLAFNIAEGVAGPSRESIVPAVLEHLGIPYTGSDAVTLGISLNKALTKRLAASAGLRTPAHRLFRSGREAARCLGEIELPVILKPNFGGSSAGIGPAGLVQNADRLASLVEEHVRLYDQPCLAEEYVNGADVTVGLLGNGPVEVLPIAKVLTAEGIYSARAKEAHDRRIVCPCDLPDALERQLTDWSLRIYGVIGARDFARVDYIVDGEGRAWFLEINPLPGLSPHYGVLPVLAAAAGYGHSDLIRTIMDLALERDRCSRSLAHERLAR